MAVAHGEGTSSDIGEPKLHGSGSGSNRSWLRSLDGRIRSRWHNTFKWLLVGAASLLALFAVTDIMKNRRIRSEIMWDQHYTRAVVSDFQNWNIGWRLEDLAQQSADQRSRISALMDALEKVSPQADDGRALKALWGGTGGEGIGDFGRKVPREVVLAKVLAEDEDLNRLVTVQCDSRPGTYLQVGINGMMGATDDACKVFSAATGRLGPQSIFEKMDLGEGQFALRAFSNGRYLRVNPPPPGDYGDVWTLEIGSPVIGIPEVFRMRDGMVYSDLMRGYLSCSGQGATAEVKGFVGETLWQEPTYYMFSFQKVADHAVERGRRLRDLYKQVHAAQSRLVDEYIEKQVANPIVPVPDKMETIALCVPMTSRGTLMNATSDSPLWEHSFRTFMATTNWKTNRFRYRWYLGFDAGDPIYDSPRARASLQRDFFTVAMQEFALQDVEIQADSTKHSFEGNILSLKPMTFSNHEHAPSRVVSELIQEAYEDGCDYFYQINDDTIIETRGWAETLTSVLRNNPRGKNVGVTGPTDTNNPRILTHAFVHRTHLEIFGRYFPYSFMNWWSDDWISNVYGKDNTLRDHHVRVTHDVRSQKTDQNNRYRIDYQAEDRLVGELKLGYVKLSKWLRTHHMPPPILPEVCGYAPLIETIDYTLMSRWENGVPIPPSSRQQEKKQQVSAGGAGGLMSGEVKPRKRTAVVIKEDQESIAVGQKKISPLRPQQGVVGAGDHGAGRKSTSKQKEADSRKAAGEFNVDDFVEAAFREPEPIATTPRKSYIKPKSRGRKGVIPPLKKRKQDADEGKEEGGGPNN